MSLEHLWAGWRSEYVTGAGSGGTVGDDQVPSAQAESVRGDSPAHCVFCRIAASGAPDAENGVLWVGTTSFAVLNAYPYASGHLMVLPIRHVGSLDALTHEEGLELWAALRAGVVALESAYGPEGINLGANLGQAAGAGIPRHVHMHAVPRWLGDTNFTTAIAGARVLPEALEVSWERLHNAWPA